MDRDDQDMELLQKLLEYNILPNFYDDGSSGVVELYSFEGNSWIGEITTDNVDDAKILAVFLSLLPAFMNLLSKSSSSHDNDLVSLADDLLDRITLSPLSIPPTDDWEDEILEDIDGEELDKPVSDDAPDDTIELPVEFTGTVLEVIGNDLKDSFPMIAIRQTALDSISLSGGDTNLLYDCIMETMTGEDPPNLDMAVRRYCALKESRNKRSIKTELFMYDKYKKVFAPNQELDQWIEKHKGE